MPKNPEASSPKEKKRRREVRRQIKGAALWGDKVTVTVDGKRVEGKVISSTASTQKGEVTSDVIIEVYV